MNFLIDMSVHVALRRLLERPRGGLGRSSLYIPNSYNERFNFLLQLELLSFGSEGHFASLDRSSVFEGRSAESFLLDLRLGCLAVAVVNFRLRNCPSLGWLIDRLWELTRSWWLSRFGRRSSFLACITTVHISCCTCCGRLHGAQRGIEG